MSSPLNALQTAIYQRLTTYSPLVTALGAANVYDFLPESATPPYVVIGDDTSINAGTKTENGWDFTITIHCWDYLKAGRKSVKNIMGLIYDALHDYALPVSGFSLTYLQWDFDQTFQDPQAQGDPDHYYHGVQRFRALISA
jgi:hypothetical protein